MGNINDNDVEIVREDMSDFNLEHAVSDDAAKPALPYPHPDESPPRQISHKCVCVRLDQLRKLSLSLRRIGREGERRSVRLEEGERR